MSRRSARRSRPLGPAAASTEHDAIAATNSKLRKSNFFISIPPEILVSNLVCNFCKFKVRLRRGRRRETLAGVSFAANQPVKPLDARLADMDEKFSDGWKRPGVGLASRTVGRRRGRGATDEDCTRQAASRIIPR